MEFNIQQVLTEIRTDQKEMRSEQKDDHKELSSKVDRVIETLHSHDNRILVVENTRKTLRWTVGVMITALLAGAIDLAFNHIKTESSHVAGRDAGGGDVRGRDVQPTAARSPQP